MAPPQPPEGGVLYPPDRPFWGVLGSKNRQKEAPPGPPRGDVPPAALPGAPSRDERSLTRDVGRGYAPARHIPPHPGLALKGGLAWEGAITRLRSFILAVPARLVACGPCPPTPKGATLEGKPTAVLCLAGAYFTGYFAAWGRCTPSVHPLRARPTGSSPPGVWTSSYPVLGAMCLGASGMGVKEGPDVQCSRRMLYRPSESRRCSKCRPRTLGPPRFAPSHKVPIVTRRNSRWISRVNQTRNEPRTKTTSTTKCLPEPRRLTDGPQKRGPPAWRRRKRPLYVWGWGPSYYGPDL
eukprot:gene25061-biopygen22465